MRRSPMPPQQPPLAHLRPRPPQQPPPAHLLEPLPGCTSEENTEPDASSTSHESGPIEAIDPIDVQKTLTEIMQDARWVEDFCRREQKHVPSGAVAPENSSAAFYLTCARTTMSGCRNWLDGYLVALHSPDGGVSFTGADVPSSSACSSSGIKRARRIAVTDA